MPSVYKRPGSSVWWMSLRTFDGRRVKRSTGERNEHRARQIAYAVEMRHNLARHGIIDEETLRLAERGQVSWSAAIDEWADELPESRHGEQIEGWVREFAKGRGAIRDLGKLEIIFELERWASSGGVVSSTAAKKLGAVARFGEWCRRAGYIRTNEAANARRPKPTRELAVPHDAFAPQDMARLCDLRPLYRVMLLTGLRLAELQRLKRGHAELGDRPRLTVPGSMSKNGIEVTIPLAESVAEVIDPMRAPNMPLLDIPSRKETVNDSLKRDLRRLGIEGNYNVRSMRKSFVTALLATGADTIDVLRLRRDQGTGATKLAAWNYCDGKQIESRLRGRLAALEAHVFGSVKKEAM